MMWTQGTISKKTLSLVSPIPTATGTPQLLRTACLQSSGSSFLRAAAHPCSSSSNCLTSSSSCASFSCRCCPLSCETILRHSPLYRGISSKQALQVWHSQPRMACLPIRCMLTCNGQPTSLSLQVQSVHHQVVSAARLLLPTHMAPPT